MAAKIIGFTERINGYRTYAGKMKNELFIGACKAMAERTGVLPEIYMTKRQASKFFRGRGVVFNAIVNG